MRRLYVIPATLLALSLVGAAGCDQNRAESQATPEPWQLRPERAGSELLVATGELTHVNLDAQALIVNVNGFDEAFVYDESTEVVGAREQIQGLVGLHAAHVTVYYRQDGDSRRVVRIEVK